MGYDLKIKSRYSFEVPIRTGRMDLKILLIYKAQTIPYYDWRGGGGRKKNRKGKEIEFIKFAPKNKNSWTVKQKDVKTMHIEIYWEM